MKFGECIFVSLRQKWVQYFGGFFCKLVSLLWSLVENRTKSRDNRAKSRAIDQFVVLFIHIGCHNFCRVTYNKKRLVFEWWAAKKALLLLIIFYYKEVEARSLLLTLLQITALVGLIFKTGSIIGWDHCKNLLIRRLNVML